MFDGATKTFKHLAKTFELWSGTRHFSRFCQCSNCPKFFEPESFFLTVHDNLSLNGVKTISNPTLGSMTEHGNAICFCDSAFSFLFATPINPIYSNIQHFSANIARKLETAQLTLAVYNVGLSVPLSKDN